MRNRVRDLTTLHGSVYVCLFYLLVCVRAVNRGVGMPLCLSACLCAPVSLSICLSLSLSICLSVCVMTQNETYYGKRDLVCVMTPVFLTFSRPLLPTAPHSFINPHPSPPPPPPPPPPLSWAAHVLHSLLLRHIPDAGSRRGVWYSWGYRDVRR